MKRGIIFDMDGTLWDSAENVAKSWNVAIRQYGVLLIIWQAAGSGYPLSVKSV